MAELDMFDSFASQPKIAAFSTTKEPAPEQNVVESDEEEEEDNQGEQVEEENKIFTLTQLGFVQKFMENRTIQFVKFHADNIFIVTDSNDIVCYEDENKSCREFTIEENSTEVVHNIFVDPVTACHVLITMTNGDNYYLNTRNRHQPKIIKNLKNMIIESVAWDREEITEDEANDVMLGTQDSAIYLCTLENNKDPIKNLKKVFDLKDRLDILVSVGPITGIDFEYFPKVKSKPPKILVVVGTPFKIFQFIGGPTLEELFNEYQKDPNLLSYKELPYPAKKSTKSQSEIHFYRNEAGDRPNSFAWLSNAGIFHGTLKYEPDAKAGDNAFQEAEVIQYDSKGSSAISMSMTEYHTLLLFPEKLTIIMQPPALCNVASTKEGYGTVQLSTLKVVFDEYIQTGTPKGIVRDSSNGEIYVYTEQTIFRIGIENEDREVWRLYLEKALDPATTKPEYFEKAKTICQEDPKKRDIVLVAKADFLFKTGQYMESADIYAKTTKGFEEVVIMYHNKGQKDALRKYLLNKLKMLSENAKQDTTQLSCLCTWLTVLYLDKINQLNDEKSENAPIMQQQFREFLEKNFKTLNPEITFSLISSHGQIDEVIFYAKTIQDFDRVISFFITKGDYAQALEILDKYCKMSKFEMHFYKFAPIIMEHLPDQMVNVLIDKKFLQPSKLIPALMRYIAVYKPSSTKDNPVVKYLKWAVYEMKNEETSVHNLLLSLYAQQKEETELLQFLSTEGDYYYETKYALRVCRDNGQKRSCVLLYCLMGMYEDAVDLALNSVGVDLAKDCANKPENPEDKKKLWLRIAQHVIEKEKNMKSVLKLLKESDIIKFEDLLPFFPDFVFIDDFKDEICSALREYKTEIDELKTEMNEATQNASLIREDIKQLKNRYKHISSNAKCDMDDCFQNLLAKDFFVFPCGHSFHVDCLVKIVKPHLPKTGRDKVDYLMRKRNEYMQDSQHHFLISEKSYSVQELKELDELVAAECPYCGSVIIDSIDEPFIVEGDEGISSWRIEQPQNQV